MALVALLVAAVVAYLKMTGQLKAAMFVRLIPILLGLVAGKEAIGGKFIPALALVLAAIVLWQYLKRPALPKLGVDEARGVLGLPPGADAETIRLAHRRLVAQVHPDKGGSADLAARVNAARDVLLGELKQTRP
jgi:hypothetical protein